MKNHFAINSNCHLLVGDISREITWQNVVEKAKEIHLPISHLINCAGVIRPGFLADYAISDIDYHLDINTKGTILGTTIIGREMKFQEFGHIINVSSLAGLAPVSGLSLYVASKFAVRGFSLAVASELREFGIDVSVICPDLVNTPMLDLQLNYPEEAKLTFSGPSKILFEICLQRVASDGQARREQARKRSLRAVNEITRSTRPSGRAKAR